MAPEIDLLLHVYCLKIIRAFWLKRWGVTTLYQFLSELITTQNYYSHTCMVSLLISNYLIFKKVWFSLYIYFFFGGRWWYLDQFLISLSLTCITVTVKQYEMLSWFTGICMLFKDGISRSLRAFLQTDILARHMQRFKYPCIYIYMYSINFPSILNAHDCWRVQRPW